MAALFVVHGVDRPVMAAAAAAVQPVRFALLTTSDHPEYILLGRHRARKQGARRIVIIKRRARISPVV